MMHLNELKSINIEDTVEEKVWVQGDQKLEEDKKKIRRR